MKKFNFGGNELNSHVAKGLVMLMLSVSLPVMAHDFRVGIVDTDRVLRESAPAIKAEKRIEQEFSARDREIKVLAKQLKDLQGVLEKEEVTLSESERRNKDRELANLNMNIQRIQREFTEDLNQRKQEELSGVLAIANRAIKVIAEKEKYDLILQEKVYHNPNIDITAKVLQQMATETGSATR
ncbi:MAG: OmpH family outer membrane protein [Candidatus Nitrotoga sp.]